MSLQTSLRCSSFWATCLLVVVSGCASSKTTLSTPSTGFMAAIKKQFESDPKFVATIEETNNREPGPNLYVAYGKLEESRKHISKAREAYNTALEKDAKSYDALLGLARLEQLAGRVDAAEQGFLKAKQIAPQSPEVLVAVGQFYAGQERWQEAITYHSQAMQTDPSNLGFRYELARVLTQAGHVDEGLMHFQEALSGNTAAAEYNVGVILYEQGRLADSEQHLLKATIHDPAMKQAQEWLDVVRHDKSKQDAIASARTLTAPIRQAGSGLVKPSHIPADQFVPPVPGVPGQDQYPPSNPQIAQPPVDGRAIR